MQQLASCLQYATDGVIVNLTFAADLAAQPPAKHYHLLGRFLVPREGLVPLFSSERSQDAAVHCQLSALNSPWVAIEEPCDNLRSMFVESI
jgi:hypothetical protein